jgi:hypothetical protein
MYRQYSSSRESALPDPVAKPCGIVTEMQRMRTMYKPCIGLAPGTTARCAEIARGAGAPPNALITVYLLAPGAPSAGNQGLAGAQLFVHNLRLPAASSCLR